MKQVCLLGATGSIGGSTLDVIARHPDRYQVFALSAGRNRQRLLSLCQRFHPQYAVLSQAEDAQWLRQQLAEQRLSTQVESGEQALLAIATAPEVDTLVAAIVGAAGLLPTLAAAQAGKRILLANKEALVMAGELFIAAVEAGGATLLPVDSEHNAIFQALPEDTNQVAASVRKLILTASGGPFRQTPLAELSHITPAQACKHPNWSMGQKISVDSASMMNKGLEVIEAAWLFAMPAEQIEVLVHPQSIIHSMVQYVDGSVLAQLGQPDMRTPIAHALAWPQRIESGVESLDLAAVARLDFEPPDLQRFPCLKLAYAALTAGGGAATVLNAANEVAVAAFLAQRLGFTEIPQLVEHCLQQSLPRVEDLEAVLALDQQARQWAQQWIAERSG